MLVTWPMKFGGPMRYGDFSGEYGQRALSRAEAFNG